MPNRNNISRSSEVEEILTKVPHWMVRWGNSLLLIIVMLLFALSWLIKYPDTIEGNAIITSKTPPQKIYSPNNGKLETLFVQDQQKVKKNQILALIVNSADSDDVNLLKKKLEEISFSKGILEFPIEKLSFLKLGEISPDYMGFEKAYLEYVMNETFSPFENKLISTQRTMTSLNQQLINLQNQKKLIHSSLNLAEKNYARNEHLFNKGVISEQELENQKLALIQKKRDVENIEVNISQLREGMNDVSKSSSEIGISSKMLETRLHKDFILAYNQLMRSILDWEMKYLVKSDIEGSISFMDFWHESKSLTAGELLFTVVPEENKDFLAQLEVPAQNSGKIKQNQKVLISLHNYPPTEYGKLLGNVSTINSIQNSNGNYLINIQLNNDLISSYDIPIPFRPELEGKAEIITEDLRLIERLFYDLKDIFSLSK